MSQKHQSNISLTYTMYCENLEIFPWKLISRNIFLQEYLWNFHIVLRWNMIKLHFSQNFRETNAFFTTLHFRLFSRILWKVRVKFLVSVNCVRKKIMKRNFCEGVFTKELLWRNIFFGDNNFFIFPNCPQCGKTRNSLSLNKNFVKSTL